MNTLSWEDLKKRQFSISCDKDILQCIIWLKRKGANVENIALSPQDGFLIVEYPNIRFSKTAEVNEKYRFTTKRFVKTIISLVKHCDNSAHEIFEDAVTIMANFGDDGFRIWFVSLSLQEQESLYAEFVYHEKEIIKNIEQ